MNIFGFWEFPSLSLISSSVTTLNKLEEEPSGLLEKKKVKLNIVCTVEKKTSSRFFRIHSRDWPLVFEFCSLFCLAFEKKYVYPSTP